MNPNFNMNAPSPRYMEVSPNGQIIRQQESVPPEVAATFLSSQGAALTGSPVQNQQWSHYSNSNAQTKQWWQRSGPFNPYRTTYQDYGQVKNQNNSTVYYSASYPYSSNSYGNPGNLNTNYPPQYT